MGVSLHYLHFDRPDNDDLKGFTLDAGLSLSLATGIQAALVGENLIDRDDPSYPRRVGGGLAYMGQSFSVDLDIMADFDTQEKVRPIYALGLEMLIAAQVPLRVGFQRDEGRERSVVGGGLGFQRSRGTQGGGLELSYQQNLDDANDSLIGFGLSTTL